MKNGKKVLISICSILTVVCSVAGFSACKTNDGDVNAAPKENEYEYKYTSNYDGPNDPGIEIDGKLDESVWQNKKWFTNHFYADVNDTMPSIDVTAFTTEYGVYMAAKVRDDNVVYIGSLEQSKNTTWEFYYYADKSDTVLADKDYSSRHAFMLDCGGELYSTCERMKRAVIVDGEVNSGATTGATVEIFVPWSEMRIDVSDGVYPKNLFLLPKYRPILKGNTASTLLYPMPFNPMHHMMNYYVFDANGYTDADAADAEVGDSFNGLAKTGNWNLEELDEGKLSVTSGVEFNSIYFKDVFAESFVAETMIYPLEGHTGYDGRYAGFWLLSTNGNYYTMMLDMRTDRYVQAQDGRNTLKEFGLVTLTEAHRYWEQVTKLTTDNPDVDVDVVPATSGIRFKIIKDKNTIHYFINDEYFYSETLDFVQGKVYAGLFNMNVYAEYEEFWCMPLEGEDLEEELNNCDIYKIDAQATTTGGYLELSKDYAVAGEDIDIKIITDSGYKVSSVICNGEDITQNVSANASKGVYRIENVNENTDFDVTFDKLENSVTYKGKLVMEKADAKVEPVSGSVILVNKNANEQRYEVVSTANRGFEVKAEAGEYELFVDGYFGSLPITLSESTEETEELKLNLLASVETANIHHMNVDFVNGSANTIKGQQGQWFIFDEAANKVYASAKIYNYDLDGFTVETEDGANVQFYFGYQGFFMLKNHDWVTISTMDSWDQYGYYSNANKMKILNPTNVESLDGSLVEIAIEDGYLYVAINGIGKAQFELSEFDSAFTATANYHVGFCTYNGTNAKYPNGGARWEEITAKFGTSAVNSIEDVKKLCAVEEYALGTELYSGTAMTKLDTTITYTAEAVGAQVFEGVEFERDTDFVVYATIASGMTAENVGFVVGTLGEDNSKHLLFQWRRIQKDLYVWRQEKKDAWGWSGTADNIINSDIGTQGAEIALVYKNGKYYAFLNGAQVCAIGIAIDDGWGGMLNVESKIGTEGTLKVGLSLAYGMVQFTNVGYSTDKAEINKYEIDDLPAIGANVYSGGAYAEGLRADGSYRLDAKNGSGAAFFEDVEIAQGQDYVVYTTISNVSGDFVGFAVGTLATPSSFAMIGWRENDIYIVRLADKGGAWGWAGESVVNATARKAADIALVYKGGEYFFFVNSEQVAYLDKDMINSLAGIGATADTVKVGFAVHWTGATSFSDWGYSVDAGILDGYEVEIPETPVEPPVEPETSALEDKLYSGTTKFEATETQASLASTDCGTYFVTGLELAQDQDFVIYATVQSGFANNIGFVVGTLTENKNHLMFHWRANDIYIWRNISWKGHDDNQYKPGYGNNSSEVEIALVFKGGVYYMFMNGAKVLEFAETADIGWGTVPQTCIGTEGTKKIGLSLYNGSMNAEWGYSIEADVINGYVPDIEEPPVVEDETYTLGTEVYADTTMTKKDDVITYTATTYGAQTLKDVELAQGTNFVVYATVEAGMTAENVGFVVGTFETESKFLMFQWRRTDNSFMVYRDGKGWAGHADGLYKSSIGTNGAKIALVYKNGTYYAFLNGTLACQFNSSFDDGWGGTFNVANQIGTTGTIKLGLSVAYGAAQFSEWGYSTEADVINGYVPDPVQPDPEEPPVEPETTVLEDKLYSGTTKFEASETQASLASTDCGTYFVKGVELAQDQDFVIYATVKSGFASNIGFVVGTLAENKNHLMFQWRANDIYIWRNISWKGHEDNLYKPGYGNNSSDVTIALVFKDGVYYMFMNGAKVLEFAETADIGWGTVPQTCIGTEGTKKIGLSLYNGSMNAEWGYSIEADVINGYVPDEEEPPVVEDETFAIGTEVYADTTMTKKDDVITYTATTYGAQTFKDVEIAQGTNFVVYATVEAGMTAENVGFVVGTFETTSKFLMFQWRRTDGTFMVYRDGKGWAGHADGLYKSSIGTNGAEIALVYKNGTYYAFLNGTLACQFNSSFDDGWGGTFNVANQIGTTGTIKLGLSVAYGAAQFSEWGYSTETDVINGYVPDPVQPDPEEPPVEPETTVLEDKLYSGTTKFEATETQASLASTDCGTYFVKGVELAQDQDFVIYAMVKSGFASNIGFVVGTLAENKNHLMFHWRANDIYIWRNISWKGHEDNLYKPGYGNNSSDVTIALVFKDGVYYMFMNGAKVLEFAETADIGWGTVPQTCIGTEGTKKIGLSLYNGSMNAEWGYSIEASEIAKYFPDTPKSPALEDKLYSGTTTFQVSDTQASLASNDCGTYFFEGVEIEQTQNFVMYATVKSGFAVNIGFVVGTLEATKNHLLFHWRANDIYLWRSISWTGHEDDKYKPGYSNNGSDVKIALAFKDGVYYMFMNGSLVLEISETTNTGWGCVLNTAIGTTGTKKIGLSLFNGSMNVSEWGYSTDADEIAKYVS